MRSIALLVVSLVVCACDDDRARFRAPVVGGGAGEQSHQPPIGGGGGGGAALFCGTPEEHDVFELGPTPAAITGGTMVALRGGGFAIADPDRARVWLLSADYLTVRAVPLAVGDDPGRVIEGAAGLIYVSLRRSAQLAEVDFATASLRRLATCELPRGLAWRASDSRVIVACASGVLETIEPLSAVRTPIALSAPLPDLRDVVIDGARLLVTQFRSATISSISADGVVSPLQPQVVAGFAPHVAWRALSRPGGGAAVVRQQHRTTKLPDASNCSAYGGFATDGRTSGGGGPGGLRNVVQSELVTINGSEALRTPLSESFEAVVLPVDAAVSATGRIAIVSAGTGVLTLLEPGVRRNVLVAPRSFDTQLTSVVFVGESAFVFSRQPPTLFEVQQDGTVQNRVYLPGESSVSTGHELFHRATAANIACASCHPEAGEDGHVWPLFEGDRRTPTLRGGIGGTAPFHWSGDLASMAELMGNVMSVRMRGPRLTLESVQSVEDWLHLQAALPAPRLDAAAVTRGEAAFVAAGCRSCHVGSQGTNNATIDVGTGLPLQVPRLVEFAWRAPWFHDGRMGVLEGRFLPSAGGELHGDLSVLNEAARADLLIYLQSR